MRLHQKVHQEIPVNNELLVSFARAFAYEYYKTAKESRDPEMYRYPEKATMADAMESKVTLEVTTIRNKIQVTIVLLVCVCVINNFKGKIC